MQSCDAVHRARVWSMAAARRRLVFPVPINSKLMSFQPPQRRTRCRRAIYLKASALFGSILGCPLSEWSWTKSKASLPSSRSGINFRSASIHAPAAFLASDSRSQALVESMLGQALGPSPHSSSTVVVAALSEALSRPDWQCLEDVDVPPHQHSLSAAIDETLYQHLLSTAPSTQARALAF